MADILRGYTYSPTVARYRDTTTGRFVAKGRITALLETQVDAGTQRLANIVQGVFAKEIAPGTAQVLMRDELRRLNLSNAALGKGGIEQLTFRDYGRVGIQLRDSYQRVTNLVSDIQSGKVTMQQAMRRIEGYTLEARSQFFAAQRDAIAASGRQHEERRTLHASESCADCIDYAAQGWVPAGTLPLPGNASQCGKYCRCTIETREVPVEKRLQTERILA